MKWFKHLTASGSDPDIGAVIDEFGFKGYYLFFRTIEVMSIEFDVGNPGKNTFNFHWFLDQFPRKIDRKTLINFLDSTQKKRRIYYSLNGKDILLNCPKLKDLTDEYTEKIVRQRSGQTPDKIPIKVGINSGTKNKNKEIRNKNKEFKNTYMSSNFKNNIIFKWNELAQKHNLAAIEGIKPGSTREKYLRARSAEKGFDFNLLIDMIENSPFLLGKTKNSFFVFFDWIIKPTNYQKIIEGNYLDRQSYQKFSGIVEGIKSLEKKYAQEKKNGT